MKRRNFIGSLSVGLLMSFTGPGNKLRINGNGKTARINKPGKSSNVVVNDPIPATPELAAPVLMASAISSSQINLAWTAVDDATNYVLERSANGFSGWAVVYSGTNLSFNNGSLTGSTTFYYRVAAEASGFISGVSTVNDETTPPVDADSPVILRFTTSKDGTKINILFDRDMASVTGAHSQFSWKQDGVGRTFSAATVVNDKTVQLTCSHTITAGEEVLLTYTPGTIQSTASGAVIPFADAPVLNYRSDLDIPFLEDWHMILDLRQAASLALSGTNITKISDLAPTGRYFTVQGSGYAVYNASEDSMVATLGTTNEYVTQREFRKPAGGKFTVVLRFRTPAAADATAANSIYFWRHSSSGNTMYSPYSPAVGVAPRRNIRILTTGNYYADNIAQSPISNNDGWHYVVATYDGSAYKLWANGTYVARTPTVNSSKNFNRILQALTARANHSVGQEWVGEYRTDAEVSTLNSYLAAA